SALRYRSGSRIRFRQRRRRQVVVLRAAQAWYFRLPVQAAPHDDRYVDRRMSRGSRSARNVTHEATQAIAASPASLADTDDETLIRRLREGDRAAFAAAMRRHNRRLYRLARATLQDDAEAEDALQDAYLRAFSAFASFRGEATLFTWL